MIYKIQRKTVKGDGRSACLKYYGMCENVENVRQLMGSGRQLSIWVIVEELNWELNSNKGINQKFKNEINTFLLRWFWEFWLIRKSNGGLIFHLIFRPIGIFLTERLLEKRPRNKKPEHAVENKYSTIETRISWLQIKTIMFFFFF